VTPRRVSLAAALAACAALVLGAPAGALASHKRGARLHGHTACAHSRHGRHSRRHASGRGCVASLRKASGTGRRRHRSAHPSASAQRAAAIARALATPCENTQLTPEPANLETARAAVLCLINRQRALGGEAPLNADPRLQAAAQSHADEMIADDYFAHVSPSGVTPVERIRATGYIPGPEFGYVIGENLAWGTLTLSTPQAIVEAWMNSPDHRANILEGRYVDTGIGIAPSVPASLSGGSPGGTYAQEFGTIVG
jgi:uncharacterized protein YkwD